MGYSRRRFRRGRGGSFLVIGATALIVLWASHPAIHYETSSFAHMFVFMMTMLTAAAIAGIAWAITANSIQNRKMARTSFWQPRTRPVESGWRPIDGQVVDAEVVKPHWETPGRKT